MPFGMVQFSPDDSEGGVNYVYGDGHVQGFSLTHMSGIGCNSFGDVFLTATTGPVTPRPEEYQSDIDHAAESAAPGYYQVRLKKWDVNAELTASIHTGVARFSFPAGKRGNILLPISHTMTNLDSSDLRVVNDHRVEGRVISDGFCGSGKPFAVFFVLETDTPFQIHGTWSYPNTAGAVPVVTDNSDAVSQPDNRSRIGAYLSYPAGVAHTVTVRVGISYVDIEGARRNLASEVASKTFDQVRTDASQAWETELSKIEIGGGTPQQRQVFYTALYHCLLMPNIFNDVDGRYIGYDDKLHTTSPDHPIYTNFSGWDIYRNEAVLLALIEPKRVQDMAQSIALMAGQLGTIDRWPFANRPSGVMNGDPLSAFVATVWNYGLHDFDINAAYRGMTQPTDALKSFDTVGFIPNAVSDTQEYSYAYWAVSLVAQALGKKQDADAFRVRAEAWRNLYDTETGFMRPRTTFGWKTPYDPLGGDGYVEGSGWQYLWLEPQDIAGLIKTMGGDGVFNSRLDSFFAQPDHRWEARYYNADNEPDLHAPFLYNWSGAPWKTQELVRKLQNTVYHNDPSGVPGNDDCGTMSAWFVLSSIGLYPVDPARPALELCSPLFSSAVVHLERPYRGKQFKMEAARDTDGAQYIHSMTVNGKTWSRPWLSTKALVDGGTVSFALNSTPNKEWGARKEDRPPSISDDLPLLTSPRIIPSAGHVGDVVTMTTTEEGGEIQYTLDGSNPTEASTVYTGPIKIADCADIRARVFRKKAQTSPFTEAFFIRDAVPGSGTGLTATYFGNRDLTGISMTRIDATVDLNIGNAPVAPGIGPENCSVRWEGEIQPSQSDTYQFSVLTDDGMRLWIDGKLIIDAWKDHSPTELTGAAALAAGHRYPIKIEYYNAGYTGACRLSWSGQCTQFALVPSTQLYPK